MNNNDNLETDIDEADIAEVDIIPIKRPLVMRIKKRSKGRINFAPALSNKWTYIPTLESHLQRWH